MTLPLRAQSYVDDKSLTDQDVANDDIEASLIQQMSNQDNTSFKTNRPTGQSVYILQVGFQNKANVQSQSNATDINVAQNGDYNKVDLNYKVNTVEANLIQNGDGNRITDYVLDKNRNVQLNLTQQGKNLSFDKFGTNTITEKLEFTQTGADKTIVVRSFN
ncbi:MAG: hypothetical protein CL868_17950 [Cytophagaceae bacterium]|nr:hypothetical protein [Cytophagaceae bacterium]